MIYDHLLRNVCTMLSLYTKLSKYYILSAILVSGVILRNNIADEKTV